jgi:hypothetical protein
MNHHLSYRPHRAFPQCAAFWGQSDSPLSLRPSPASFDRTSNNDGRHAACRRALQAVYYGRAHTSRLDLQNGDGVVLRGPILEEIGSEALAECRVADVHVCAQNAAGEQDRVDVADEPQQVGIGVRLA